LSPDLVAFLAVGRAGPFGAVVFEEDGLELFLFSLVDLLATVPAGGESAIKYHRRRSLEE
jgi:hypothetical protein